MKELGTFAQAQLANLIFGGLTMYRLIPAMCTLVNRGVADKWDTKLQKALDGLGSLLYATKVFPEGMSHNMVFEIIDAHKNWICYTFYDMVFYFDRIQDGTEDPPIFNKRMEYYLPAMAEIVNSPLIEWRYGAFDAGVKNPTILDVGSGHFPFVKLFRRDCIGNIWYIGVDPRGKADKQTREIGDVFLSHYSVDVEEFLKHKEAYLAARTEEITTVFFGNSLHCMQEPTQLLEKVAKLPKVTKVMVLEFAPKSALNFMFDFHMYMHAGTGAITELSRPKGWRVDISYPTTQHMMLTYTKE